MDNHSDQWPKKRNVLLIYRRMIPSLRLCGHCQMQELAAQGKAAYRAVQEMHLTNADMNWADIVLLGRLDSWYESRLVKALRKAGKRLVYVIDDDLLCVPREVNSFFYYGQKEIHGFIRGMIDRSDVILSPSPLLLQKYAVDGRKAVQIEEPAVDPVPYEPHDQANPVKIGFAGSIDRISDIETILKDALLQIRREYGEKVVFEFFGAIPSFAGELNAKCIPYTESYDDYRKMLNEVAWDIGLAPMPDTPFHACKHYNKFVEYAAAGITGIFSQVYPYTRIPAFQSGAVLCENSAEAWIGAIRAMLNDREKLEDKRKTASAIANGLLSVKTCSQSFWREMEAIQLSPVPTGRIREPLLYEKTMNIVQRGKTFIRKKLLIRKASRSGR